MRFKSFIIEGNSGNRGVSISDDKAVKILRTKCKRSFGLWLKTDMSLFRGMDYKGDFYSIDPSKSVRVSQNTQNYYTLIMDNHPSWKGFPKRSKSIICTTYEYKAEQYGNKYHMFSYDGAAYGVAPEDDIWFSFGKTFGTTKPLGLINSDLNGIAGYFRMPLPDVKGYPALLKILSDMGDRLSGEIEKFKGYEMPQGLQNSLIAQWSKNSKVRFDDWFLSMFDPKPNGIYYTKDLKKVLTTGKKYKEVWTDSKTLLISSDTINRNALMDDLMNDMDS